MQMGPFLATAIKGSFIKTENTPAGFCLLFKKILQPPFNFLPPALHSLCFLKGLETVVSPPT